MAFKSVETCWLEVESMLIMKPFAHPSQVNILQQNRTDDEATVEVFCPGLYACVYALVETSEGFSKNNARKQ